MPGTGPMNGDVDLAARQAAARAQERADTAAETALHAWEGVGELLREFHGFRSEMREGFSALRRQLQSRASRNDLDEIRADVEDSKVHSLRKELATLKRQRSEALKWVCIVAAGVAVAALCAWLGLQPHHG
jgi:hypothetical protein